ncbi:MAG: FHA domain-containing protein [Myxococcaceae bacterium]
MLSIKELAHLGASLKPSEFRKQLGPFVLIQRPPEAKAKKVGGTDAMGLPSNEQATQMARPEAVSTGTLALLFQFDDLLIATLPPLHGVDELSVGRQPDCDLVVDHPSVSKQHGMLRWDAKLARATLQDLGSTNGTFLNASIKIRREAILKDGDIISFGEVQFWYLLTETLHTRLQQAKQAKPQFRGV